MPGCFGERSASKNYELGDATGEPAFGVPATGEPAVGDPAFGDATGEPAFGVPAPVATVAAGFVAAAVGVLSFLSLPPQAASNVALSASTAKTVSHRRPRSSSPPSVVGFDTDTLRPSTNSHPGHSPCRRPTVPGPTVLHTISDPQRRRQGVDVHVSGIRDLRQARPPVAEIYPISMRRAHHLVRRLGYSRPRRTSDKRNDTGSKTRDSDDGKMGA
jgi:hypothetical protein